MRDRHASAMKDGRVYAEYLGDTRGKYTHENCGHVEVKDFSKGPLPQRCGPDGARLYASWHSREKGGAVATCGVCERARRRDLAKRLEAGGTPDVDELRRLGPRALQRYLEERARRRRTR